MTAPLLLDPEIEGLLQEIAADPRSHLLRIDRPTALKTALDSSPRVSVVAAGLTRAERHLLSVHRAEVAWLLREACLIELMSGQEYAGWIAKCYSERRIPSLLSINQWDAKANRLLSEDNPGLEYEDARRALDRSAHLSVTELAGLSLRVSPSDNARNYLAISLIAEGKHEQATTVLIKALATPLSCSIAIATTKNLALCFGQSETYADAIDCLQIAHQLDPEDPEILLNLSLNALLCDNSRAFLWAAERLSVLATVVDLGLDEFEQCHMLQSLSRHLTVRQRHNARKARFLVKRIRHAIAER